MYKLDVLYHQLYTSVIRFDQSFHPVVLYENYLICIFMNINENLKNGDRKPLE